MRVLVACEFSGIVRDAFIAKGHDAVSCDLLPSERPGPHIQGDVLPLLRGNRPCAKLTTRATVISPDGWRFSATNWCRTPQAQCPRAGMATGIGYDLCKTVCGQSGHAEVNACKLAGAHARGGWLFLEGHTYACDNCQSVMRGYGINRFAIGVPPENVRSNAQVDDYGQWDLMITHPPCTHLACSGARWFAEKRTDGRQQAAVDFFMALVNAPVPRIATENPIGIMSRLYRKPDQTIQPWQFGHGEVKATCLWLKGLPLLTPTAIVDGRTARVHKEPPGPDRWKNRSRTYPGIANAMAEQWGNVA